MPPSGRTAASLKTLLGSSLESSCWVSPLCMRQWKLLSEPLPFPWQWRSRKEKKTTTRALFWAAGCSGPLQLRAGSFTALLSSSLWIRPSFLLPSTPPPSLPLCFPSVYLPPWYSTSFSLPFFSHLCTHLRCDCSLQTNMWERQTEHIQ